jgi:hypothetical protein
MMKKAIILTGLIIISCGKDSGGDLPPIEPLKFTLTVSAGEGGSVDTAGGTYNEGTSLTITATPDSSYEFDGWSGTETSSENPLTFNLTSNENVTANFKRKDPIIGIWSAVFFEGTEDEYVEYVTFEPDGTLYALSLSYSNGTVDSEFGYLCSGSWSNNDPNGNLSNLNQSYLFELISCSDGEGGDSGTISITFESNYEMFSVEGFDGNYSLIDSQDTDGDSVPDHLDLCPDTSAGAVVDEYGC